LFLWAFGKGLQRLYRITGNTQVGYTKTGIYSNHWLVGNLKC